MHSDASAGGCPRKRIANWLVAPNKTAVQLQSHLRQLQWHIQRLYRIRCCIVHGSPICFRLALFAANLEYYLKQTLMFSLNAFHEHPHITDLAGLFQRGVITWQRHLAQLGAKDANNDTIADAVFADVLIKN